MPQQPEEEVLRGGPENAGSVVRRGDTVLRPRGDGHAVVEGLLTHLETVGFEGAPQLLGIDRTGRQILTYVEGDTFVSPPWHHDDRRNAAAVGAIAGWLRRLHEATVDYRPPAGSKPKRPLPVAGDVWTHGDPGYPNIVYREGSIVGLIDWEFAAPADRRCDLAALLATSVRGPRPDADDNARRERAVRLALVAITGAYGLTDAEIAALPLMAATAIDDLIRFKQGVMDEALATRWAWRAAWFREHAEALTER